MSGFTSDEWIFVVELIGEEAAMKLREVYGGDRIHVPSLKPVGASKIIIPDHWFETWHTNAQIARETGVGKTTVARRRKDFNLKKLRGGG